MTDLDFIIGLMKQDYEALGFIPRIGIEQYIQAGHYCLQTRQGIPVGYLLHGSSKSEIMPITQTIIDFDYREKRYGIDILSQVIERARQGNAKYIRVRCAKDLPSNDFWVHVGFKHVNTLYPNNKRKRAINVYYYSLYPELFKLECLKFSEQSIPDNGMTNLVKG